MKTFSTIVLVLVLGVVVLAEDCKNGSCPPRVAVPQAVVKGSVEVVKGVASAPCKVAKKVQAKRPVRSFIGRLFKGR